MEFRITVPYELEDGTPQPFDAVFTIYDSGKNTLPEPKTNNILESVEAKQ